MPRRSWRGLLALLLLLPFAACAPQAPRPPVYAQPQPGYPQGPALPMVTPAVPRTPVGLLLPLSGSNRALGQAMLNAAQLALFDQADPRVEFLPRDTGGTASGAAEAARGALGQGARVLAGPLTLGETAAAAAPARAARVPMMAFTSDAAQAGGGVWVLGVTPAEQVDRMVAAAAQAGARRFALLAAEDEFGRRLSQAMRARLAALGLPAPLAVLHPARGDVAQAARDLATQAGEEGLDAVLLGHVSAAAARVAAATLAGALPRPPRFLGTHPWAQDSASLAQEPALAGAWFPGPDPAARAQFDSRYQSAFGERPPRLAGVAYDAAALAARTARDGGGTPPVGEAFLGADGPIRMLPEGQMARGLAVFAIEPGGEPRLVEPAPVPGLAGS